MDGEVVEDVIGTHVLNSFKNLQKDHEKYSLAD